MEGALIERCAACGHEELYFQKDFNRRTGIAYDCQAVHRGYPPNPAIQPFDLVIHDRHVYGAAPPGAEER